MRKNYKAVVLKLPQTATLEEHVDAIRKVYPKRHTIVYSLDDTLSILDSAKEDSYVISSLPARDAADLMEIQRRGYRWEPLTLSPTPAPPQVPKIIDISGSLVPKNPRYTRSVDRISLIVVHHFAANTTIRNVHNYHNTKFGRGIAYHFVIDDSATIYQCIPVNHIGTHASGYNTASLAICFTGDLTKNSPSKQRLDVAKWLIEDLKTRYPSIRTVLGHGELPLAKTACPGATKSKWLPGLKGL